MEHAALHLKTAKVNETPAINRLNAFNSQHKIIAFEKAAECLAAIRACKKVVQCHGVFDLLHIGHIKHLEQAKNWGDILVVTITADRFVNKGPGRPYFTERYRAEALAALACVDYVVINYHATAVAAIEVVQPDFYVKGMEYQNSQNDITQKIIDEECAVVQAGGRLVFTQDIVFSSSTLLNRFYSPYPPQVVLYLEQFKERYAMHSILKYLEAANQLKVLLIGEAIIDIYHFGEALGKSGKEPVLVTKYHREERYIGGVLAVANHLSSFCSHITCLTMIGEKGQYEPFIRDNSKNNINIKYLYKKGSPTIVKRRYLEEYSLQKLFEIYEIDDAYLDPQQQQDFIDMIDAEMAKHDIVIVTDYGHGLLDQVSIEHIEKNAKFLAVNTQSNASNHGFNCISKYKTADYVCIATRELQLNYRQKHISVSEQLNQLQQEYDYKNIIITYGVKGSLAYKKGEGTFQVPAFTTTVKDRVGAGDAVLAVTSLCVAQGAPAEVVGYIGNVVGAQAVNIMGNEQFIEKITLMKHISHMLK